MRDLHPYALSTISIMSGRTRRGGIARDALMALAGAGVVLAVLLLRSTSETGATAASSAPSETSAEPLASSPTALVPGRDGAMAEAVAREAAATVAAVARQAPEGALASSPQGLGAFPVRDMNGATVAIVPNGTPAIVMINSRTCGYCKQALADLAQYAKGREVPGLRMLTLEGATEGLPMLRAAGVSGATPLGPATSESQILLTFRYRGTPTFVAVDAQGVIRGTMAGYPGAERLAPWFDVMLGDRIAP